MSDLLILLLILVLAVVLIAGGLFLSRRSSRAAPPPAAAPDLKAPPPTAPPEAEPSVEMPVETPVETPVVEVPEAPVAEPEAPEAPAPVRERPRLRDRLGKTRAAFSGALTRRGKVDPETWDELEEALLLADVGLPTTQRILEDVKARAAAEKASDSDAVLALLKRELTTLLEPGDRELVATASELNVWMFVGVNGVGKTTTIAKLAQREVDDGHKVVLAAADTFRAAAADQLGLWAERAGADLVRGQDGADPGSVVFDAMSAASTRGADLVMVDTAGRLHTKVNLMEELKKLRRIVERTPGALKEVLLVVDATTGQNGLAQARQFAEAVEVTGVVLTKLDGTAKGGIALAIAQELGVPVKLIGIGETLEDLRPFDPDDFARAIIGA
jgi:fused signal recognition particle receptor